MNESGPHDFVIIGAGIAGASLAYALAEDAEVILLERELQPGYHATGRSAAMFMESYGTPTIQALTRAGRSFYQNPPAAFGTDPILAPRGVLYVATPEQKGLLREAYGTARHLSPNVKLVTRDAMLAAVPCLRPDAIDSGMAEPDACDIDVHALHQGYLRGFRQRGGKLLTDAGVVSLVRQDARWRITLGNGETLIARNVVNAAGAWADAVAKAAGVLPIGLQPRRRSAFIFAAPEGLDSSRWPAVVGIDETYYFKPDAGQLLGSPANADPMPPHDVVPEELDIATGIYHIEQVTTMRIRRPKRIWAGLRTFAPDGDFVIGWDNRQEGFFWLAAQGGYGIQTAAGASALALDLLLGRPLAEELVAEGVAVGAVLPDRIR